MLKGDCRVKPEWETAPAFYYLFISLSSLNVFAILFSEMC
ncbi:hypothetical protein HMPREF9549_02387 [Escherichia coli MS 185-1]|nr:hypothetical protein HMPREF9549_02387 [Escherichia coli MS 185-1]